jgi:hypothetical protein
MTATTTDQHDTHPLSDAGVVCHEPDCDSFDQPSQACNCAATDTPQRRDPEAIGTAFLGPTMTDRPETIALLLEAKPDPPSPPRIRRAWG